MRPGRRSTAAEVAYEVRRGPHTVTTDPARFDLDVVHGYLTRSYWAEGIPRAVVERSIAGSLCFGLLEGEAHIGFARAISDRATFWVAGAGVNPAPDPWGLAAASRLCPQTPKGGA